MPDQTLKIGAEFDVSQIVAGAQQAGVALDSLGDAVARQAAIFQKQGLSVEETSEALRGLGYSATEISAALGTQTAATEAATAATVNFREAMGAARVEMGALTGSTGMMGFGLARVAASSEMLAPLLLAAFPIFGAIALVDILGSAYEAFGRATDKVMGYTKEVQAAEKAAVKFSETARGEAGTLQEAYEKLSDVLRDEGTIAEETFSDKWAIAASHAEESTSHLLSLIPGVRGLVVTYEALAHAESDAADAAVRDSAIQETLVKESLRLQEAQATNAVKLIDLQTQATNANLSGSDASVQAIKNEIAALDAKAAAQKKAAETAAAIKYISSPEAAKKAGGEADVLIDEETYLKRIELTGKLSKAEQEEADKAAKAAQEHADAQMRALERISELWAKNAAGIAKLSADEAEFFAKDQEKEVSEALKASEEKVKAWQKYTEEIDKLAEESALKQIAEQEKAVSGNSRLAEQEIALSTTSASNKARLDEQVTLNEIAQLQKLNDEKLAKQKQYNDEQMKLLLGGQDVPHFLAANQDNPEQLAKLESLNRQIEDAQAQHDARMEDLETRAKSAALRLQQEQVNSYMKVFDPINRGMDAMVNGILQGTLSASEAFRRMGANMVISTAEYLAQIFLKHVEHELALLLLHQTTNEAKVASDASAAAQTHTISALANLRLIIGDAGVAAAKAFTAVVGIPIVGPFLAPAAAAAAFAGVMAFETFATAETGGYIPRNMPVFAHAGETMLSPKASQDVGKMAQTFNAGGGGDTTNVNMHVSALDSKSVADFLHSNRGQFTKMIRTAVRNGVRIK